MNIIKVENVKRIIGTNYHVEVKTEYNARSNSDIIILSEDDINNDNSIIKLKGILISTLIIPKKFKYTFNDMKYYELIKIYFDKNIVISYY